MAAISTRRARLRISRHEPRLRSAINASIRRQKPWVKLYATASSVAGTAANSSAIAARKARFTSRLSIRHLRTHHLHRGNQLLGGVISKASAAA